MAAEFGPHALRDPARVVVKLGSSLVRADDPGDAEGVDLGLLQSVADDVAALVRAGSHVALVSSGAVAVGRARLGLADAPSSLDEKQAAAAAGQPALMAAWARAFSGQGLQVAQALLTLEDTERRRRWLNARATLERLFGWGAIPIVNENDTVATDELRYGDNDRLAARVAQLIGADALILLSDVDGLYTADPRKAAAAKRVSVVEAITPEILNMAGGAGSSVGTGGMRSKVEAARIATAAGCAVAIAPGGGAEPLRTLRAGGAATWFRAATTPQNARRAWIAGALSASGAVQIDAGAVAALMAGRSLLPVGVTAVTGAFEKGDAVRILSPDGGEIARGLTAYDAAEARKIAGLRSQDAANVLGYDGQRTMIHRDDMVLVVGAGSEHG